MSCLVFYKIAASITSAGVGFIIFGIISAGVFRARFTVKASRSAWQLFAEKSALQGNSLFYRASTRLSSLGVIRIFSSLTSLNNKTSAPQSTTQSLAIFSLKIKAELFCP